MATAIAQIIIIVLFPYLIIKFSKVSKFTSFMSPILICYLVGIIWTNMPNAGINSDVVDIITMAGIPLAIPLILFSTNFKKWLKMAKTTVLSFILVILSVTIATTIAFFIFKDKIVDAWKYSGMLVGVYTGGTPNLFAVGKSLGLDQNSIIAVSGIDVIIGGLYFLFLISIGKWILSKFLLPYKSKGVEPEKVEEIFAIPKDNNRLWKSGISLLLSLAIVGISVGLSILITGGMGDAPVLILVTTLGVLASFSKKVRDIPYSYDIGQYVILIFSISFGMQVNIQQIIENASSLVTFTSVVMFGAIIIHFIFAKIFKIDRDTAIITSTAGIYGPAFIGSIATSLKNKEVIIAGFTSGIIGYAVGNYLGLAIAWLLSLI